MAAAPFSQAPGLTSGCLLERWASWPSYSLLEAFWQQPGVGMASAEPNGWEVFHQLLRSGEVPARLCTDAYLAALSKPELPRRYPAPRPLAGPPARNSWGDGADLLSKGKGFSAVLCCSTEC